MMYGETEPARQAPETVTFRMPLLAKWDQDAPLGELRRFVGPVTESTLVTLTADGGLGIVLELDDDERVALGHRLLERPRPVTGPGGVTGTGLCGATLADPDPYPVTCLRLVGHDGDCKPEPDEPVTENGTTAAVAMEKNAHRPARKTVFNHLVAPIVGGLVTHDQAAQMLDALHRESTGPVQTVLVSDIVAFLQEIGTPIFGDRTEFETGIISAALEVAKRYKITPPPLPRAADATADGDGGFAPPFTEGGAAFTQLGMTDAGQVAVLRIGNEAPVVGTYRGFGSRAVKGHEGVLLIEPALTFPFEPVPPDTASDTDDTQCTITPAAGEPNQN